MTVRERIWREMVTYQSSKTTAVKKEPTFSKQKDSILKSIESTLAVERNGDREQCVVTLRVPVLSHLQTRQANAPTHIRRSSWLNEQARQPSGSCREPSGAGRTITRRKKTGGRRKKNQPLQRNDIISALKRRSKEELDTFFRSLSLSVVEMNPNQSVGGGDQQLGKEVVEEEL